MANGLDFSQRSFYVITGASRGIGKQIATEIARKSHAESSFLLLARSGDLLTNTKTEMLALNPLICIHTHAIDLTKPTVQELENVLTESLIKMPHKEQLRTAVIIHNAGSVGDVSIKAADLRSLTKWQDYFSFNLFSVATLNSLFIKQMSAYTAKLHVVNITSLCGREPFGYMAEYGSGKAARDMFFRVLAEEEGEKMVVLNYSPGPVDTDMVATVIATTGSAGLKKTFCEMIEDNTILTTEKTVLKLLSILEKGDYISGATIDYYDRD